MNKNYADIIAATSKEPLWFDEHGVPRFAQFRPDMLDIYASEGLLLKILCQSCKHEFLVGMSLCRMEIPEEGSLKDEIKANSLHYGDPPNVTDCCFAGPTMNSIPVQVMEFWERKSGTWTRCPEWERPISPSWMKDDEDV